MWTKWATPLPAGTFSVTGPTSLPWLRARPGATLCRPPPLCSLLSRTAPEGLHVCLLNPHSRQWLGPKVQALLGAQGSPFISAKVSGLCPQNRKQQCTTGLIKQEKKGSAVCVCVCMHVWRGGALCKTFIAAVDWVLVGGLCKNTCRAEWKGLFVSCNVLHIKPGRGLKKYQSVHEASEKDKPIKKYNRTWQHKQENQACSEKKRSEGC